MDEDEFGLTPSVRGVEEIEEEELELARGVDIEDGVVVVVAVVVAGTVGVFVWFAAVVVPMPEL